MGRGITLAPCELVIKIPGDSSVWLRGKLAGCAAITLISMSTALDARPLLRLADFDQVSD